MFWKALAAAAALWMAAAPAKAAWYRAETDRFIVLGEGERKVRDYAAKLQSFDVILRLYHPSTADRVPYTKVQVVLVEGSSELRRVYSGIRPSMRGFYAATNEGVFAVAAMESPVEADDIIFHEYAHHFMWENFPAAYPAWFVEGYAEYFAPTEIKGRDVIVGSYNPLRATEVQITPWVPLQDLLSLRVDQVRSDRQRSTFYSQAWLLMHYMRSSPERAKQLDAAITAIAAGAPPLKAFQDATGKTPEQLTAELRKYRRLPMTTFKGYAKEPSMTVERLPDSANDFLLDHQRLLLSSVGRNDTEVLERIRRNAARYPGDPLAERTLARAEAMYGDLAKGEALIEKLVAARPTDREALVAAGWVQLNGVRRDRAKKTEHLTKARTHFAAAYKLDNTDFRPLLGYAYARMQDPSFPTDNDLKALLEARALAPAVEETAFYAGIALIAKGRREDAAKVLSRVLNNPHGGRTAEAARTLLAGKPVSKEQLENALAEDEEAPEAPEPSSPAAPPEKTSS